MAITANDRRTAIFNGNDVNDTFAYDFKIYANTDLLVFLSDATGANYAKQTLSTHYTVTGVGAAGGGNVVFVTPPATGKKVLILGETPYTQATDITDGDALSENTLELNTWDVLAAQVQQLKERIDRCLKVPTESTQRSTADKTAVALDVPTPSSGTAGQVVGLDSNKAFAFLSAADIDLATVGNYMQTVLPAADAAAALALLTAIAKNGSIAFTGNQSMGSNKLTNLANGTASGDAVNKGQLDAQTAGIKSVQVFTGNGTWTRPAGVTKVTVEVVGGGGGAGGGSGGTSGGGAGAGGYCRKTFDVSGIASSTVVVGTGGAGGAAGTNGNNGVASSWTDGTNTLTANGGGLGGGSTGGNPGSGGTGGTATGGDVNVTGSGGGFGLGAGSYFGGGARFGGPGSANGDNGGKGAGGGGGWGASGTGGNGGDGLVVVTEF